MDDTIKNKYKYDIEKLKKVGYTDFARVGSKIMFTRGNDEIKVLSEAREIEDTNIVAIKEDEENKCYVFTTLNENGDLLDHITDYEFHVIADKIDFFNCHLMNNGMYMIRRNETELYTLDVKSKKEELLITGKIFKNRHLNYISYYRHINIKDYEIYKIYIGEKHRYFYHAFVVIGKDKKIHVGEELIGLKYLVSKRRNEIYCMDTKEEIKFRSRKKLIDYISNLNLDDPINWNNICRERSRNKRLKIIL